MGLFGRLKDRITHRKSDEDVYDFRSHVLGEPNPLDEPRMPEPVEPLPARSSFDQPQEPDFSEPIIQRHKLKDLTIGQDFGKQYEGKDESSSRNYDILDRLNIIEAQLSAIRSQTETINERLKNMEMKLGPRRY